MIGESIFLLLGLLRDSKGGGHESLQCYYLLHAHVYWCSVKKGGHE